MKHKLKKWHIALMSFLALFIAVFTSLFSLRADTVDDETGELLTDNWELGVVFYDSTVDGGKTPLTEINWDASDDNYKAGTPRTITVQINYKNTSAVTTYSPGELEIRIPNLIYKTSEIGSAQWTSSAIVGANDTIHTGYDWTFNDTQAPSGAQEDYCFVNANTIEENSNFEGSIQIQYIITPASESPERYVEQCIHNYNKILQATLGKTGTKITTEIKYPNVEHVITSPNWPNSYPSNLNASATYWEYTSPNAENLLLYFDPTSNTDATYDYIHIYDNTGKCIYSLSGSSIAGNVYPITGNYVKIAMKSDAVIEKKGFHVSISDGKIEVTKNIPENLVLSNKITMNYTRTYIHSWKPITYTITKTASKITSYDGLISNASNYIWVKYNFGINRSSSSSFYPDIHAKNFIINDTFPEECIVLDGNMNVMPHNNNAYAINFTFPTVNGLSGSTSIYVGYPQSIYNEEANNLIITNYAELYGTYENKIKKEKLSDATVSINLNDFQFQYEGNLYSVKKSGGQQCRHYSQFMLSPTFNYHSSNEDYISNDFIWKLESNAIYTGTPLTVKIGDDLLYITDENGNYRKLEDNEYSLYAIRLPILQNGNGQKIPYGKYEANLYVRYANEAEYVLYKVLDETYAENRTITIGENEKIVGFYFEFVNLEESLKMYVNYTTGNIYYNIHPTGNISTSGSVYNFSYIQVYIDGILQNEPDISNYNSLIAKKEIATFDQETYGTYMQRHCYAINYSDFSRIYLKMEIGAGTTLSTYTQDVEKEIFYGSGTLKMSISPDDDEPCPNANYRQEVYFNHIDQFKLYTNLNLYTLLPDGFDLKTNHQDLLSSITVSGYTGLYKSDGTQPFQSNEELKTFILSHGTLEIIENYQNTNRTKIVYKINFPEMPLANFGTTTSINFSFDWKVSYDNFLEYGNAYPLYVYTEGYYPDSSKISPLTAINDNGKYDSDAFDINNNGNSQETLSYAKATTTITSVVSTHQDVTTYAKTNQSNYSTGTVDASNNSNYEYKLRVRTGIANITNLIIYSNLEEAQPERQRWKGEFLGIDTSYAKEKGYTVKPYYSENPKAGNLINENGTLNSDWKEFISPLYTNGLRITFNENCATYHSSDYLYIYYNYDNKTYRSSLYSGTTLAGKTIEIPTTDFYIYWYSNGSGNNAYGFSIDKIEPCITTNILGSSGYSIPSITITEMSGNNYPETEHSPYKNSEILLWHYSSESLLLTNPTDTSLVKSLAFQYLDSEGNPAILPANSLTYVTIQMKSPDDESIKTLARMDCRTQWNALDDYDRPVDFITGINSNVVKVALPNSVDEDSVPNISLRFTKEIQGTDSEFENMKLNIADQQIFMIRLTDLTANEDGSYNQVTALLRNDQELIISQIPIGTYLLEELGNNYFDFIDFTNNNDPEIIIEGVTLEKTLIGYILTVSEDLSETVEFNIKVTNEIEDERFYEDKDNKENLFLKNKIEEDSI